MTWPNIYMNMLTRKQQQGIKILESIVQSEYPFVISLKVDNTEEELLRWPTTLSVSLEIDPITLRNILDIPFDKKFKERHSWNYYTGDKSNLTYLVHFFPDEYHDITGFRFNAKMEDFMSKVYTQLPANLRVNVYNLTPEDEIPSWALGKQQPRSINIGNFTVVPDVSDPTVFND